MSRRVKKNQHYVPQFYLRFFSSDGACVSLMNLARQLHVDRAPLRRQCYQKRLYGDDDRVEDAFSRMEDACAPILREIVRSGSLPGIRTREYRDLLLFIAFQRTRTSASAKRAALFSDSMFGAILEEDPSGAGLESTASQLGCDRPVLNAIRNAPMMASLLEDLRPRLLVAPPGACFITSDNPVYLYNQYCQGLGGVGVAGANCRGVQVAFPLSPGHLFFLYDGTVYSSRPRPVRAQDVDVLNAFQFVSASENVYYLPGTERSWVSDQFSVVRHRRGRRGIDGCGGPRLMKADAEELRDGESKSMMIAMADETPNLRVRLSFLRVKSRRSKVPLTKRMNDYRHELDDERDEEPRFGSSSRNFVVRREE